MLQIHQLLAAMKGKGLNPEKGQVVVMAIRGNTGQNRKGIFDDRAYIIKDGKLVGWYDMNTDPSSDAQGRAVLQPGIYDYRAGWHHLGKSRAEGGRPAFRQASAVKIHRIGARNPETGWYGINLHDAKSGTTSSEGCQTWQQYGNKKSFSNSQGTGFKDVMYGLLGVDESKITQDTDGIGPIFKYWLLDLQELENLI